MPNLGPAARYELERTWRQLRNGRLAGDGSAGRTDDRQAGVGLSLEGGQLVQARSDLVQDEESDGGRHADVSNKPTHRVE